MLQTNGLSAIVLCFITPWLQALLSECSVACVSIFFISLSIRQMAVHVRNVSHFVVRCVVLCVCGFSITCDGRGGARWTEEALVVTALCTSQWRGSLFGRCPCTNDARSHHAQPAGGIRTLSIASCTLQLLFPRCYRARWPRVASHNVGKLLPEVRSVGATEHTA